MSLHTVQHNMTGETVEVDTEEEVVSAPIFDLHDRYAGAASWWEVGSMESAADYLTAGDMARARVHLGDLNMTLVEED